MRQDGGEDGGGDRGQGKVTGDETVSMGGNREVYVAKERGWGKGMWGGGRWRKEPLRQETGYGRGPVTALYR